jgi:hypothetical protein
MYLAPFSLSQVHENMTKVLKTLALGKLTNPIFPNFELKKRPHGIDFIKKSAI